VGVAVGCGGGGGGGGREQSLRDRASIVPRSRANVRETKTPRQLVETRVHNYSFNYLATRLASLNRDVINVVYEYEKSISTSEE